VAEHQLLEAGVDRAAWADASASIRRFEVAEGVEAVSSIRARPALATALGDASRATELLERLVGDGPPGAAFRKVGSSFEPLVAAASAPVRDAAGAAAEIGARAPVRGIGRIAGVAAVVGMLGFGAVSILRDGSRPAEASAPESPTEATTTSTTTTQAPVTTTTAGAGELSAADAATAAKIDAEILAGTGMAGLGTTIVQASREHAVPVDFALAIFKKEAAFVQPDTLAERNRNPGNLRWASWQAEHGGHAEGQGNSGGGFTAFPTLADGTRAAIALLGRPSYADAVARRDWGAVLAKYAPPSENDTGEYTRNMYEWSAGFRDTLGIGEDWLAR
jgi:hypothetical protein